MYGTWEIVHNVPGERVRRIVVPGGWLYQVELVMEHEPPIDGDMARTCGWTAPAFVPQVAHVGAR